MFLGPSLKTQSYLSYLHNCTVIEVIKYGWGSSFAWCHFQNAVRFPSSANNTIHLDPSRSIRRSIGKNAQVVGARAISQQREQHDPISIHHDPSADPSVKAHKSWVGVRMRIKRLQADPSRSIRRSMSKCTSRGPQCDFVSDTVLYLKF